MNWFNVDKHGLAKLLERRGKEFILFELIQNALDEDVTEVRASLERIPGKRAARLMVEDDHPNGFSDLTHAFTLFAESSKKGNAKQRGRFNLGEKLVLALCDEAEIASTKGTIAFTKAGRTSKRARRARGSRFEGILRMTDAEIAECEMAVKRLLPPAHVKVSYNGQTIPSRTAVVEFEATLLTEIADDTGALRRTRRNTSVRIIEPLPGELPYLYELGIPVVELGDLRWHVDVSQKIPLAFERDNVTPSYLGAIRALVLKHMQARLTAEDVNATWVRDAVQRHGEYLPERVIERVMDLRFGEKRVAYDPSDPEANSRAVAAGYAVIHGGQLSRQEWDAVRRAGAALPAGQVTPSPKPFSDNPDAQPLKLLDREKWTPAIESVVSYAGRIGQRLLDFPITVQIASAATWPYAGAYGGRRLILNVDFHPNLTRGFHLKLTHG
ncbi:MAG: hypothetical protein KJZ90_14510, partial [Rhodocyclaceae bacterium]|nr:hypothetical protein [Rhodocyclaceae bacterium]